MHNIRRFLASLVGDLHWRPPAWPGGLAALIWRRKIASLLLLAALLATAGGWLWVGHLPKPVTVAVEVMRPGLTPVRESLIPENLVLRFGASVAPLDQIGQEVTTGVRMEPSIPGHWAWISDNMLRFKPGEDWPAATSYRVTIDRAALPAHVRLASYRYDWKTPDFTATVREIEFYQDPRDPTVKQVVATVDLSHQVDPQSLVAHAGFFMLGRKTDEPFDVSYDKHHRTAYLRTKPVTLPEQEDFVKLTLGAGLRTVQGGAFTQDDVSAKCRVPDLYSFFQISGSDTTIVRNDRGEPDQVLTVSTTGAIASRDLAKALHLWILPKKPPTVDDSEPRWEGPREITPEVLSNSRSAALEVIPSRDPVTQEHAFRFHVPEDGQLYVRIDEGLRAPGGFVLGKTYDNIASVPKPSPTVAFEGDGSVLALSGERKLSVKSRNVPAIEYRIARVATSQINHLVSQTSGNFGSPEFRSYCFDEENISRLATERQTLAGVGPFAENFTAFDFGARLAVPADGGSERGLFFLTARGWDPKTKKSIDGAQDSRFLLVTDLGLIVKENADGSRELFVASIKTGLPQAGVQASILGKNGVAVAQGVTDGEGHICFPAVGKEEHDREPVAFVARLGDDVAFLPYNRQDRKLDFSRFDTGGDEARSGAELTGFLFTERGVYRPGDTIHAGYIVKRRDWLPLPAGLPLEIEVLDARGRAVLVKRIAAPEGCFGEIEYPTEAA
ncbi:MAG TPA: MG2 domain-containing protein, partial [Chthoniobacterales bacterium]|nr:MG2 domain-containing protein [Chthoniobacterales bacterium]